MTQAERIAGAIAYFSSQVPTDIESLIPTHPIDDVELTIYRHMQTALGALRGPQPDPETGLVPCGCGGKAEVGDGDKAFCGRCGITTLEQFTQEDAKSEWNRAMGYKEDA